MAPALGEWDPVCVFERLTDRARRCLVLAQEEARLMNHSFIGTEHLLLGLIGESDGLGAKAIGELGISLEDARTKVREIVGTFPTPHDGSPPFTPRAKKVLELALREALQFGHNYIGTEHLLLGLVREGEGVAAQVFVAYGVSLDEVRQQALRHISGVEVADVPPELVRSHSGQLVVCSFCGDRPPESGRLISGRRGAFICENCVRRWHDRFVEDTGDDQQDTPHPEVVTGRTPAAEEPARMEIALAFGHALVLSDDRRTVPSVEGGELLGPCLKEAQVRHASWRRHHGGVTIDHIEFLDENEASVVFTIAVEGVTSNPLRGRARVVDSTRKVARETFCLLMSLAGVDCPPAPS
jgi:Clp amino terminal domain, pathogenicity island component/ClpX C4-type zinc finger